MSTTDLFRKHFGNDTGQVNMKHPGMEAFLNELNSECMKEDHDREINADIADFANKTVDEYLPKPDPDDWAAVPFKDYLFVRTVLFNFTVFMVDKGYISIP